jgi:Spy/CpxP family protein refolding chaperone
MKLNNLTKGVIAFSVLSMLASGVLVASAASDTTTSSTAAVGKNGHGRGSAKEEMVKPENMTAEQKAEMETKRTALEAKFTAVKAAITASDYSAWVAAEKAINENSPLLTKITADNFSKYVEANNLRAQAEAIMEDLGIEGMGLGQGRGGFGLGHGGDFSSRNGVQGSTQE